MTKTAICTSCRKFVKYIVKEAEDYITMCDYKGKNHIISYTRKYAYCFHCGKELYVPEIEDYNAKEPIKQWHKLLAQMEKRKRGKANEVR